MIPIIDQIGEISSLSRRPFSPYTGTGKPMEAHSSLQEQLPPLIQVKTIDGLIASQQSPLDLPHGGN